jgi:hypothetical protein
MLLLFAESDSRALEKEDFGEDDILVGGWEVCRWG